MAGYICSDCGHLFDKPVFGFKEDGIVRKGCPKCGCGQYKEPETKAETKLKELRERKEVMDKVGLHVCPHCGRCPLCGRRKDEYPWPPLYPEPAPWYPIYPDPWYPRYYWTVSSSPDSTG